MGRVLLNSSLLILTHVLIDTSCTDIRRSVAHDNISFVIVHFYLFAFQTSLVADRSSSTYTAYFALVEPQSSCYQTEVSIILHHCSLPIAYTGLASLLSAYRYTCSQY